MNVPFYIARKYFFSSKKINYVHILSLVSQFGIAIGTIALVLVMSVFNGFENLVLDMYNVFDPHIRVTSNDGKNFDSDQVNKVIGNIDGVANFSSVLEEKILVEYNSKQYIAVIKGVDANYRELTNFDSLIVDGGYIDDFKSNNVAMVGRGIAYYLSMHIGSVFDNLRVYLPNRDSKNLLKLEKAFTSSSISPVGVFGVQQEIDSKYIIVPLNFVQDLINRDKYVSAIEIKLKSSDSMINIQNILKEKLDSKYLIQNTLWWIEYARLSGIRVDTYPYSDKDFMSDWTLAVMDEYPNFNIVGEEWSDNPIVISYWQKDKINHDGYVSFLPTLMDFPLQISFTEALLDDFSWGNGFIKPYKTLASDFLYPNPNNLLIFPDNHDMTRFFTQVNNDIDLFKMGIVYYSTMRGIPQFYYGTEILMNSDENPGDHGLIRTEFPGGWPDHSKNAFTGDGLSYKERQTQLFFKEILNWRKDNKVIHNGKLIQFAPKGGIYSFFRILNNKMVWVIFNRNNSSETLETSRFDELIENYEIAFDVINKKKVSISEKIIINAKSALILEIE